MIYKADAELGELELDLGGKKRALKFSLRSMKRFADVSATGIINGQSMELAALTHCALSDAERSETDIEGALGWIDELPRKDFKVLTAMIGECLDFFGEHSLILTDKQIRLNLISGVTGSAAE